jgi:hypothetical protein
MQFRASNCSSVRESLNDNLLKIEGFISAVNNLQKLLICIKSAMLYQLSYRPIDNLQGIFKLGASFGAKHGLLGLFRAPT